MRLFATLEYDGTDFLGFQTQKRGRTVQGELERAITRVTGEKIRIVGGGRTDAGVHAAGQAAHWDTHWKRSLEELQRALNAVLPADLAIMNLRLVSENFSARFSAHARIYRYTILNEAQRSPLAERFALWVKEPLDALKMDSAARLLIGTHDFGAFGRAPSRREYRERELSLHAREGARKLLRGDNTTREMHRASVSRAGARIAIEFQANAFLYRMVRRMVGTLLQVGKGRLSLAEFRAVFEKKKRAEASAPPNGLCLLAVRYAIEETDRR